LLKFLNLFLVALLRQHRPSVSNRLSRAAGQKVPSRR
jgi:hypothetical protein